MSSHLFGIYHKPLRFPIGKKIEGKMYLDQKKVKEILRSKVVVEEKMDGQPVLIIGKKYIILAEDLEKTRSIKYKIPARFAIFEIYDKKRGILSFSQKISAYYEIKNLTSEHFVVYPYDKIIYPDSFFMVRTIAVGYFSLEELPNLITYSTYALEPNTYMEGIVIKKYAELAWGHYQGKIITNEINYQIQRYKQKKMKNKIEYNIIDPSVREVNSFLENTLFLPSGLLTNSFEFMIKAKN